MTQIVHYDKYGKPRSEDADKVDGIHASTTPTASQLLAMNASAKFPAHTVAGDLTAEGGLNIGTTGAGTGEAHISTQVKVGTIISAVDEVLSVGGDAEIWNDDTLGAELITNGGMELDSDWANYNTPPVNERSDVQAHGETYSRHFTADSAFDGIRSAAFSVTASKLYRWVFWVYPDDSTQVYYVFCDGGAAKISEGSASGLTQDAWNQITVFVKSITSGAGAYVRLLSGSENSGGWYVDDVSVKQVVGGNLVVRGTLTVDGDQTGATDHVFDHYDDLALLRTWRDGKPLPFPTGDMLNRDRLLRDTILQLAARVSALETKLER